MRTDWKNKPAEERFGVLWPALVDLLKEMDVPFVLTAQFTNEDAQESRPFAFHLVEGMSPRIMFSALLAKEGTEALGKMIPGFGELKQLDMALPEGRRRVAELEESDAHVIGHYMPRFMDSMRDIEIPPPEAEAPEAP